MWREFKNKDFVRDVLQISRFRHMQLKPPLDPHLGPSWPPFGRLFGAQDRPNLLLEPFRADPKLYRSALGRSKSAFKTGFSARKILWTPSWSRAGGLKTSTWSPRAPRAAPGALRGSIWGLWDLPKELQDDQKTPWNQAANNSTTSSQSALLRWSQARRNARER